MVELFKFKQKASKMMKSFLPLVFAALVIVEISEGRRPSSHPHVHKKPQVAVAFTARMFEDATDMQAGDVMPYTQEVVDTANAFVNSTFTAPKSGLYFFTWSVTSLPNYPVDTSLMKDNEEIGKLSCHNFSNGVKRNTCAQSTLVQLKRNDNVSVEATEAMSRVSGTYWPTFSGYRL